MPWCALDQIPLELGQGGEYSEHHATGRSRGVDLERPFQSEPAGALLQIVGGDKLIIPFC